MRARLVRAPEQRADYDGLGVRWGIGNKKATWQECEAACAAHEPTPMSAPRRGPFSRLPCNVWTFCSRDVCFEPDAHKHSRGDCWLKFSENPEAVEVNMREPMLASFMRRHKREMADGVPWVVLQLVRHLRSHLEGFDFEKMAAEAWAAATFDAAADDAKGSQSKELQCVDVEEVSLVLDGPPADEPSAAEAAAELQRRAEELAETLERSSGVAALQQQRRARGRGGAPAAAGAASSSAAGDAGDAGDADDETPPVERIVAAMVRGLASAFRGTEEGERGRCLWHAARRTRPCSPSASS